MSTLRLVDLQVAVTITGRPASTIRRWITEGRLTRHGTPGAIRLDHEELREVDLTNPDRKKCPSKKHQRVA